MSDARIPFSLNPAPHAEPPLAPTATVTVTSIGLHAKGLSEAGLLQDEAEGRGLSRALAGKPDARLHAREAAAALAPVPCDPSCLAAGGGDIDDRCNVTLGLCARKGQPQPIGIGTGHIGTPTLQPCRSPYCECEPGKCTHPGCFDARHVPAPPEVQAATDAALDLVELPPIRVNRETYESLKQLGLQRGMILQPLVREAIQLMLGTSATSNDVPVGWQERQQVSHGGWTPWYSAEPRNLSQPRSKVISGIEFQWRPLYLRAATADRGWKIVHDGDSVGMLESPDGRVFRLQEFVNGAWGHADDNDELLAATGAATVGQPSYVHVHVDEYDKLGCCRRMLEMIAKGECDDPAATAKQELVAHGFWNGE